VLLVVHEISCIYGSIFVKILTFSLLFILEPIADIELSLHIIILPLSLLHSLKKVPLITLRVQVSHLPPSVRLPFKNFSLVIGSICQLHLNRAIVLSLRQITFNRFLWALHIFLTSIIILNIWLNIWLCNHQFLLNYPNLFLSNKQFSPPKVRSKY
jgi:hypothetical protein